VSALARFQDAFFAALVAGDPAAVPPEAAAFASQPAFAVYRNTVARGLVDAIVANFPAVARLVGDEWMRAAANVFVRQAPPRDPTLAAYGEGFADFLVSFAPARDLPWLAEVACVDRAWTEAHVARDEPAVDPAAIASFSPERLAGFRLAPHAAARWRWSDEHPIHALWTRSRAGDDDLSDVAWRGEGVLVTRPAGAVEARAIDRAGCAFLDACASGATLADAAGAALDADRNADLARLMASLVDAGALAPAKTGQPS